LAQHLCRREVFSRLWKLLSPRSRMPFVPIGSRKPIPVVLDDDKQRIRAEQQAKDDAKVAHHYGLAPSTAGYRFGNHPMTKGFVRGPDVPFRKATSSWKPAGDVPDGPHAQMEAKQAHLGAFWEGAHGHAGEQLRKSQSSPTLKGAAQSAMELSHPLSVEIKRWEKMAAFSEKGEMNEEVQKSMSMSMVRPEPAPKPKNRTGGLVNFPKYMLIHNCHLKHTDLQRYQREQAEQDRRLEEAAARGETLADDSTDTATLGEGAVRYQEASWGAPLLRQKDAGLSWAGAALPGGRGSRHSSFLRMG